MLIESVASIDIIYIFCHSKLPGDWELRYSLRSVERNLPWVRKVWVLGDRPEWLSENKQIIEHVPHQYLSRPWRLNLPVRNSFWLTVLASLIPDLTPEFLWFADDYIVLEPIEPGEIMRVKVFEDLATLTSRGRGHWKDALWRTHDLLKRLGYGTLNCECHVPMPMSKRLVWEAFCEFQDFMTEDRYYGPLMLTTLFNYAVKRWGLTFLDRPRPGPLTEGEGDAEGRWPLVMLNEGRYVGFYRQPHSLDDIRRGCEGKTYLNFDDAGFGEGMQAFLAERFSTPSIFEQSSRPVN